MKEVDDNLYSFAAVTALLSPELFQLALIGSNSKIEMTSF